MILTIYNGSPLLLLFFGIRKIYSTAFKTYPRVTTDWQTYENEKCENYYTHKFLSKTLYFAHNNKNGSV